LGVLGRFLVAAFGATNEGCMRVIIEAQAEEQPSESFEVELSPERAVTIGRGTGNDVKLNHPSVSRRHAGLRMVGDAIHLDDLGSSHGTYHRDARVEHAVITLGDDVRVGQVALRLRRDDD
jgi:pSer/pThr/pTyr-binding forkhead associated (FHA) protein